MGDDYAEPFERNWEDKDQKIHEIKVNNLEITEDDGVQRIESRPQRSGPAWNLEEANESQPSETVTKGKYMTSHLNKKKPPVNDKLNFPGIGLAPAEKSASEAQEAKSTSDKKASAAKGSSSNPYGELEEEEEKASPTVEEKKSAKKPSGKKKGSKKQKWTAINANVKIATTAEEKDSNVFQKEEKKVIPSDSSDRPKYESKGFQIKPSGQGFRNFDNKPAESVFSSNKPEGSSAFGPRRTENFVPKPVEESQSQRPIAWRNMENKVVEEPKSRNPDIESNEPVKTDAPRKFFNSKKAGAKPESSDPLMPKEKEPENSRKDVWGENIKEPQRKNAWAK